MEERVLKISSMVLVLTIVLSVTVLALIPEVYQTDAGQDHMSGLQQLTLYTEQAQEQGELDFEQQLRIELPEGVTRDDVVIENDYMEQLITIRIPNAGKDYFKEHPLLGKTYHIDDLYMENGVIDITLDSVFEVVSSVEEGCLYIDFVKPQQVYDKVVAIDAGHGGTEPGAVKQGIMEKDINLAILKQLKKLLDENDKNIGVYYTRTEDVNPSFEERARLGSKIEANIFISIHSNSTVDGQMSSYNGTEVMYDELKSEEGFSSKRLAQICLEETTETMGSKNNGVTFGNSIYIIRSSEVPVALIEVGFMTNQEELNKLTSERYQKKAAKGIYKAILRALEEGY